MRLSTFVSFESDPQEAIFNASLPENMKRAAADGVDGVELQISDPDTYDVSGIRKGMEESGLVVSAINSYNLFRDMSLVLVHEDQKVSDMAVAKFKKCLEIASEFNIVPQIGVFRGPAISDKPVSYSEDMLVDILKCFAEYAEKVNVTFTLEATNRYHINWLHTTQDVMRIINRVGSDNIGQTLDLYHMYLEDDNLLSSICMAKDVVKNFHFFDSDVLPPGCSNGVLDFKAIIKVLSAINYKGWLGINLVRSGDVDAGLKKSSAFVKGLIEQYK